jgi:hypothetical protein
MLRDFLLLSRLTLALALLYIWLISVDGCTIREGLRHLVDRNDRRDLGIFQIGLRYVRRGLTNAFFLKDSYKKAETLEMLSQVYCLFSRHQSIQAILPWTGCLPWRNPDRPNECRPELRHAREYRQKSEPPWQLPIHTSRRANQRQSRRHRLGPPREG